MWCMAMLHRDSLGIWQLDLKQAAPRSSNCVERGKQAIVLSVARNCVEHGKSAACCCYPGVLQQSKQPPGQLTAAVCGGMVEEVTACAQM
jgi:hypothetical protein